MSNAVLTENEERLFGAAKEAEAEATQETKKQDVEELKKKYTGNGQKIYTITNTVAVDDDTEEEFTFLFRKPKPASYDRYVKTISNSASKASKTFAFDNIIDEQRDELFQSTLPRGERQQFSPKSSLFSQQKLSKIFNLNNKLF